MTSESSQAALHLAPPPEPRSFKKVVLPTYQYSRFIPKMRYSLVEAGEDQSAPFPGVTFLLDKFSRYAEYHCAFLLHLGSGKGARR
jgi:hypothetical protein